MEVVSFAVKRAMASSLGKIIWHVGTAISKVKKTVKIQKIETKCHKKSAKDGF